MEFLSYGFQMFYWQTKVESHYKYLILKMKNLLVITKKEL